MRDDGQVLMKTYQAAVPGLGSGEEDPCAGGALAALRARLSRSRQTIRSVTALLGSNLAASLLTAAGGLLVARFIGPEVNGAFRAFTIPLTYLVCLHLGTWDGLSRQIPYFVGKDDPAQVDRLAAAAGAYNLLLSAAGTCAFVVCAAASLAKHDLPGVFGWLSQALYGWGLFYGGFLNATYRTLHHFGKLARIQLTQSLLTFGMVFLLQFLGFYGLCVRASLPSFLAAWLFHRNRPLGVRYRLDLKALRELVGIGLPFAIWGNLYSSVWVATESALVLALDGVSALGLLAVAAVIAGAVNSLPSAIWQVLTPCVVTNLARDGSVRRANGRIGWVTVGLTGCMILIACAGSWLLELLVPLVIPKYVAGIAVMKLCLWFPVITAAFLPLNVLFATGRPWLYGRSVIAGIVVFALATWLLLPALGGLLAVVAGSLCGRAARVCAAYVDLAVLSGREGHLLERG